MKRERRKITMSDECLNCEDLVLEVNSLSRKNKELEEQNKNLRFFLENILDTYGEPNNALRSRAEDWLEAN